jgi:hypothetical protein
MMSLESNEKMSLDQKYNLEKLKQIKRSPGKCIEIPTIPCVAMIALLTVAPQEKLTHLIDRQGAAPKTFLV